MTVIEVHPEELLDRELRGTLTEREQQLLSAHLQRCSACRMEQLLRADFEDQLHTPAQGLDLQMFVSGAIKAMEIPGQPAEDEARDGTPSRASSSAGSFGMRRVAAMMVACAVLSVGVGIAAAQLGLAGRAWQLVREGMDTTFGSRPSRRPTTAVSREQPTTAVSREQPTTAVSREQPTTAVSREQPTTAATSGAQKSQSELAAQLEGHEPPPEKGRAVLKRVDLPRASASSTPSLGRPARAEVRAETAEHGAAPRIVESAPASELAAPRRVSDVATDDTRAASASPSVLFENANVVRHRGHAIEASGLYRELQARYPHSAEARLSVALVARLQLDQGENAAALSGFEAYLVSSDVALREEAMTGRVRALSRLGREQAARSAARDLLDVYPQSAFAPAARKLLESTAK